MRIIILYAEDDINDNLYRFSFLRKFYIKLYYFICNEFLFKDKNKAIEISIAAVLFGAIYVIIYYITQSMIYLNFILKIFLSIIIIYVSFTPKKIKEFGKYIIIFYLVSFVFGGTALGVIYMVNFGKISILNGVIIGNYSLNTIFIGVIIGFILIMIAFNLIKNKISRKDLFCNILIKINNKGIRTKAMIDTGNQLREPITNIPVVIVEHNLLDAVIPKEILENVDNILGGDLKNIPDEIKEEYLPKLKIIPFSSLGKQNGILLGIKANEIIIEDEDVKKAYKAIIGIYNKKLSKKGEYQALLGIDMG